MRRKHTVLFCISAILTINFGAEADKDWLPNIGSADLMNLRFKEHFKFGVSTSAYQIEGASNRYGKGENIWDRYLLDNHQVTSDGINADEACDSYHQIMRDVVMLKELGVDFYRFSISWSRVLPTGFPNIVNEEGLQYYSLLINALIENGITPFVTLYHNDLPQRLQDLGGWANPYSVIWFKDYAKLIFDKFSGLVKQWVTINNPSSCFEPPINDGDSHKEMPVAAYLCVKHMLMAHATVYKDFKKQFKGNVGLSVLINHYEKPTGDKKPTGTKKLPGDKELDDLLELTRQAAFGLYIHPIFSKEGGWPPELERFIANKSKEQGFFESRLPKLSKEEIDRLKGASDFIGVNHYTSWQVGEITKGIKPTYVGEVPVKLSHGPKWKSTTLPWFKIVPNGMYQVLLYLNRKYDYPKLIITENGLPTPEGLNDRSRLEGVREYMKALLFAIEDGANVQGYSYWSLMDTFDWNERNNARFGLYEVDFSSPNKTRTPRLTALFYKYVTENRSIAHYKPKVDDNIVSTYEAWRNARDEL